MVRRALSVVLALACSLEVPAVARGGMLTPPPEVDAKAEALDNAGQHLAAAKEWEDALAAVPESIAVRVQRNHWVTRAVNAYDAAFEADPSQCAANQSSLRVADEYLRALIAVYGLPAQNADDYVAMKARRDELDQVRVQHGCPAHTAIATPVPTGPETVATAPAGPVPPAAGDPPPGPRRGSPGLAAGLGVSAALGVAMLTTSLVLYFPLRKGTGRYYTDIEDAAQMHNVPTDKDHDMCVEGKGIPDVAAACEAWHARKTAFVVTAVLAGAFAASAAVFTGLLIRKRRQSVDAVLRRHRLQFAAAPRREGGVMLIGGLRF